MHVLAERAQEAGDGIRQLTTLLELSQALSSTPDLKSGLQRVLELLERDHELVSGAVTLLRAEGGDLGIEASVGLLPQGQQVRYQLGEGITGRVVESGKPIIVPQVSKEPLFLHRAFRRKGTGDVSFVCVPLAPNKKAEGALAVELEFQRSRDLDGFARFLRVIASMIAQAIKVHRVIEAERQRLLEENQHLRLELEERYDFSNIVGTSGPMREVYQQISQVAGTNTTVLIRGESGTGKELIAHAIHYHSPRRKKPFVRVSCAALPETLVESELFGYEKGAFTGADARKKGRFEIADGGTLFLDEIGELNLATQAKLLRALQEREFERLGGTETIRCNVRVIAGTNKDLEKAIAEKTFREDLYYRLNVFSIFVPPLRERKADIMMLADHFLTKYAREHHKSIRRISTPAIDMLVAYHWPGNVRELENIIERAVVVCEGGVIHGHHLPPTLQTAEASGTAPSLTLKDAVSAYERDLVLDALKSARGNAAKAARLLQTTERILGYKIRKYELDPRRFKA